MRLYEFFEERASGSQPLVLVTVYETEGSTYSKAGGHMIIDGEGNFCGMLSGGCLEGDLVERAREVIRTGEPQTASFDLGADDELWGLGVGCDGTMRVLLQPLLPQTNYQPFAAFADVLNGGSPVEIAIVVETDASAIAVGSSVIRQKAECPHFGMSEAVASSIAHYLGENRQGLMRQVDTPEGSCTALYTRIESPPSLLVLGAGLDSEPLVRIADELGWRCTVADHRSAYVQSRSFPDSTRTLCCEADKLKLELDLNEFDLVVVMSHHLASDRAYLRQLAETDIGYIGLLGPAGRRDRLMSELSDVADTLQDRLHGPAGIELGGRGPGPIALAIVAEMQQFLNKRG